MPSVNIDLLGNQFVLGHDRIEIGRLVADDSHVGKRLTHLRAPKPISFSVGTILVNSKNETASGSRSRLTYSMHSSGRSRGIATAPRQEPIAHPVTGIGAELLAVVALGLGQLRVVVAQGEAPEHDVAGFVLHDVGVDRLSQRIAGDVADQPEGGQGQALDKDLHPEIGHVPPRVAQDVVEKDLRLPLIG